MSDRLQIWQRKAEAAADQLAAAYQAADINTTSAQTYVAMQAGEREIFKLIEQVRALSGLDTVSL